MSDLGQLKAFTDPLRVSIVRVLQHQEMTIPDLSRMVDQPEQEVAELIEELTRLGLVKEVEAEDREGDAPVYGATARIFHLTRSIGLDGAASATITSAAMAEAMAVSIGRELGASLTMWPDQFMNSEGRRARLSLARALEFDTRLRELVDEFWGGPDLPADDDPVEPLMSFVGLWYRFPEEL